MQRFVSRRQQNDLHLCLKGIFFPTLRVQRWRQISDPFVMLKVARGSYRFKLHWVTDSKKTLQGEQRIKIKSNTEAKPFPSDKLPKSSGHLQEAREAAEERRLVLDTFLQNIYTVFILSTLELLLSKSHINREALWENKSQDQRVSKGQELCGNCVGPSSQTN